MANSLLTESFPQLSTSLFSMCPPTLCAPQPRGVCHASFPPFVRHSLTLCATATGRVPRVPPTPCTTASRCVLCVPHPMHHSLTVFATFYMATVYEMLSSFLPALVARPAACGIGYLLAHFASATSHPPISITTAPGHRTIRAHLGSSQGLLPGQFPPVFFLLHFPKSHRKVLLP